MIELFMLGFLGLIVAMTAIETVALFLEFILDP